MARELTAKEIEARKIARTEVRGRREANTPDRAQYLSEGEVNDDPWYNNRRDKRFRKRADAKQNKGAKNAAEMNANARQRTLRSLVKRASDIKNLTSSDIKSINSLATSAANDYKGTTKKDEFAKVLKATPVSRSLLSIVARGAPVIGAVAAMNELRKVHKEITDNPKRTYGSQTLLDILMKD